MLAVARCAVARVALFVLALATSALAQTGVAPTMGDDGSPLAQMPALNGLPSKHDEPSATDNDHASCAETGGNHNDGGTGEFDDEQDTGDPVGLHNGMVSFRATDLVVPGRGIDYELTRRYNSKRSETDGPLGYGWAHNYDIWLQLQGSACSGIPLTVILWNGNNRVDIYRLNETTCEYTSPRGVFTKLTYNGPVNQYTLRTRYGTKTVFNVVTIGSITYGRLASITDRNGNALGFTYTANTVPGGRSRLRKVIDVMGREITYSYTSAGRVSKVTDFTNREVNYAYDTDGNLISARGPAVLFACAEHLAPLGRIERYRYFGGASALAHNLTEIVRPNQGQSNINGQAAIKFEYHTDSDNWAYGWCTKQTLGNPGVGVGGEIDYSYYGFTFQPLDQPAVERIRTTVVDRRGYTTEYLFNENGHCLKITEYTDLGMTDSHVTTITYDASPVGYSEGLIKRIVYPRGNEKKYTYVTSGYRWAQGNIASIQWLPGVIASDQTERTISYEWEPVFQHIRSVTDERGFTRTYFCDWMEGSASDPSPNVIDLAAAELGIDYGTAQSLIGGALTGADLNGDGRQTVLKGNLVQVREPNVSLAPAGLGSGPQAAQEGDATQQAVASWTYNAYGQTTSMTDAEENVTVYLYNPESDPDGDGTTNGGDDTVTGGYVRREVEDTALPFSDPQLAGVGDRPESTDIGRNSNFTPAAAPTNQTTDFTYTKFGYQKAVIDARGVKHDFRRNDLGEVYMIVRAASVADVAGRMGGCDPSVPEDLTGQAYSYVELFCHDFNGNVAERRVQNSGNDPDAGLVSGWLESNYEYDRNDNLKSESHEYGQAGEMATTSYLYDENDNLSEITEPEGNKTRFEYDGHDHLWKATRGFGTAEASTDERLYDDNGNLVAFKDGSLHTTTYSYDGFDRVKTRTEPIGTLTTWTYDAASNVTHVEVEGMSGGPSQVPPPVFTTLAETESYFDERSRPYRIDRIGPNLVDGAILPGDGRVTTRLEFDRLSRRTFIVEDDAQVYSVRFDGGHRPVRSIDPVGNEVTICWDDDDNPVEVIEIEKYPNASTRSFETYTVFDSLDRRASVTNELGETARFTYDSRDNLVASSDAQAALVSQWINGRQVNGTGNTARYRHDGLNRLLREELDLRVGGTGDGAIDTSNPYNADGVVVLLRSWDKNGRLTSRSDDKGNVTSYAWDALNRQERETLADSNFYEYTYAPDDRLVGVLDPNGTSVTLGYDVNDRLTNVDAVTQPSANLIGTKALRFEYDGLGRRTFARDDVDGALDANDWIVTRTFDALGRVLTEAQGTSSASRTIIYQWKEEAKRTQIGYPSGIAIDTTFDALDRVATIQQGAAIIASYAYAGPGRVLERLNGNGTYVRDHDGTWNDAAYFDGARRPTRVDHVTGGGALLTGLEHAYDRVGNRLFERRLHDGAKGDNYVYDSLYRLVTFERRVPAVDVGVPGQGNQEQKRDWRIDGVQNWRELIVDAIPTLTTVNTVNEYTTFGVAAPTYDANGNTTQPDAVGAPLVSLRYDFLNRLRRVDDAGIPGRTIDHTYDAEGRRVRTTATASVPEMPAVSEFVFDGWEEIEEWSGPAGSSTLLRRYVHGHGLDEPVRLENLAFYPGTGTYWYQQSTLGNVAAIADATGAVVERYTYDAYGSPRFETAANVPKAVARSDFGNPCLFNARRYESSIYALYDYRARFYDPARGRFIQRDAVGAWGDGASHGSAFAYVGSRPLNGKDPYGTDGGVVTVPSLAASLEEVIAAASAAAGSGGGVGAGAAAAGGVVATGGAVLLGGAVIVVLAVQEPTSSGLVMGDCLAPYVEPLPDFDESLRDLEQSERSNGGKSTGGTSGGTSGATGGTTAPSSGGSSGPAAPTGGDLPFGVGGTSDSGTPPLFNAPSSQPEAGKDRAPEPQPSAGGARKGSGRGYHRRHGDDSHTGSGRRNAGYRDIFFVETIEQLDMLFRLWTTGGVAIEGTTYEGPLVRTPDGSSVGRRTTSKSGGPAIDVKRPDGTMFTVHVVP